CLTAKAWQQALHGQEHFLGDLLGIDQRSAEPGRPACHLRAVGTVDRRDVARGHVRCSWFGVDAGRQRSTLLGQQGDLVFHRISLQLPNAPPSVAKSSKRGRSNGGSPATSAVCLRNHPTTARPNTGVMRPNGTPNRTPPERPGSKSNAC